MSVEVSQSVGESVAKCRKVSVKVSQSVAKCRAKCRKVSVEVSQNVVRKCGVEEGRPVSYSDGPSNTENLQLAFKRVFRAYASSFWLFRGLHGALKGCESLHDSE